MTSFFAGLGAGISLIMAIGAQNAFVLKQGLMRHHVLAVCLFCAASDAILIALGVAGVEIAANRLPWLLPAMRWGGAAFLLVYGACAVRSAWLGGQGLRPGSPVRGLTATLLALAALTCLNPHVYLGTVVLLGAVASQWPQPWGFGAGAMTGSLVSFLTLGFGARFLAPVLARPRAWQWLDLSVGCVMWTIAARLALG